VVCRLHLAADIRQERGDFPAARFEQAGEMIGGPLVIAEFCQLAGQGQRPRPVGIATEAVGCRSFRKAPSLKIVSWMIW
jgi:hypothetical protein